MIPNIKKLKLFRKNYILIMNHASITVHQRFHQNFIFLCLRGCYITAGCQYSSLIKVVNQCNILMPVLTPISTFLQFITPFTSINSCITFKCQGVQFVFCKDPFSALCSTCKGFARISVCLCTHTHTYKHTYTLTHAHARTRTRRISIFNYLTLYINSLLVCS